MNPKIKNIIYIFLGLLFVFIGAIGVVLPVLPTTPFLLLASFFFTRGSEKFNNWFISTKLYQNHLDSFLRDRSMELKTKIRILIPASMMLVLAAFLVDIRSFRMFIGFMMIYKYYYFIFKIKTITPKKEGEILWQSR